MTFLLYQKAILKRTHFRCRKYRRYLMHTISSVSESGDPENQIVRFPVNISIRLYVNFYYYFFFTLLLLLNRYANINNIWYKLFLYEVNIVKIKDQTLTQSGEKRVHCPLR